MSIGILAVQGAFAEHEKMLDRLGQQYFEIRKKSDIEDNKLDALILPGGESTVMNKLLKDLGMFEILKDRIADGLPTYGTCAGLLLLAKSISNENAVHFGVMDIVAKRNAYGRQLGSFMTESPFADVGRIPMVFIRAPYIESLGPQAEALAAVDGKIVAARHGNIMATAFHPELSDDLSVHKYFIDRFVKPWVSRKASA